MRRIGVALLLFALWGRAASAEDTKPPTIKHVPPVKLVKGEPLVISADFDDEHEVWAPTLYHRVAGTKAYATVSMEPKKGSTFAATITPAGDLEYWLEAYDEFGNGPARRGSSDKPVKVAAEKSSVRPAAMLARAEVANDKPPALPQPPPPLPPPPVVAAPALAPVATAPVVVAPQHLALPLPELPAAALAPEPVPAAPARGDERVWWIVGGSAAAALVAGGVTALVLLLPTQTPTTTYRGVTSATLTRPAAAP